MVLRILLKKQGERKESMAEVWYARVRANILELAETSIRLGHPHFIDESGLREIT